MIVTSTTKPNPSQSRNSIESTAHLSKSRVLIFDLETIPDHSRLDEFGLPELPEPKPRTASKHLHPPQDFQSRPVHVIAKYIEENRPEDNWLEKLRQSENTSTKPRKGVWDAIDALRNESSGIELTAESRKKLLSVTPEYCSIVAAAWCWEDDDHLCSFVCHKDPAKRLEDEKRLLAYLWSEFSDARTICGFNIISFDIEVIRARSIILGVAPTRMIDPKPWGTDVCDLYRKRFPGGKGKEQPGKLKDLAGLYGIPVPAGDVEGSQVAGLFESDHEKLREYVVSDVEITRELYRKMKGYYF